MDIIYRDKAGRITDDSHYIPVTVCPHSAYLWAKNSSKGFWAGGHQYDRWGVAFKTKQFSKEMMKYFKDNKITKTEQKQYILNNLYCYYEDAWLYNIKTGGQRADTFDLFYIDEEGTKHFIYHNEFTYEDCTERGLKNLEKLRKTYGDRGEDLVNKMRCFQTREVYDKALTDYSSTSKLE